VFAYELLFRDSLQNVFPDIDDDYATAKIIEGLHFNLGLDTLAENKLAFINFTQDTLVKRYPTLLPKEQLVIEVLETVKPGKRLLEAIIDFKKSGYTIALDDYEHKSVWRHFYPYIDIIKIDWTLTSTDEIKEIIEAIQAFPQIKLLAEKIETYEEFNTAKELGFVYFQGYFFSRPEVIQSRTLNPSQLTLANIMAEMSKPEPNVEKVGKVFENDVNLSFKLLRYTQSPLFKRNKEINNIKQAIVVLGNEELRRFVSLLFAVQFSGDKPEELTIMSLARARFCELVATQVGCKDSIPSAFLVGLLSLLDAMLDSSLPDLLEDLPLSDDIKLALCKKQGVLAKYLEIVKTIENAQWHETINCCSALSLDIDSTQNIYKTALVWAEERARHG
jgi:EAL and modified HD-GYP domain-containing signal transduction protein